MVNVGDLIFQLIAVVLFVGIPVAIIFLIILMKRNKNKLVQLEERIKKVEQKNRK